MLKGFSLFIVTLNFSKLEVILAGSIDPLLLHKTASHWAVSLPGWSYWERHQSSLLNDSLTIVIDASKAQLEFLKMLSCILDVYCINCLRCRSTYFIFTQIALFWIRLLYPFIKPDNCLPPRWTFNKLQLQLYHCIILNWNWVILL